MTHMVPGFRGMDKGASQSGESCRLRASGVASPVRGAIERSRWFHARDVQRAVCQSAGPACILFELTNCMFGAAAVM
jgi:hypothetical protein